MVPSIARQSVILKCNMQKSVLTGNYEYYYAAGLFSKLAGIGLSDEIRPAELKVFVREETENRKGADEREEYLYEMLRNFKPGEEYDEQMKELLLWGKSEDWIWNVTIPSASDETGSPASFDV